VSRGWIIKTLKEDPENHFKFELDLRTREAMQGGEAGERHGHIYMRKHFWLLCEDRTEGEEVREQGQKSRGCPIM
jgi:hypothetical protein